MCALPGFSSSQPPNDLFYAIFRAFYLVGHMTDVPM
ncbi:hypothetical protein sce1099 [Sorangium cellulosum So ce56]|uniref:Uncharacterized protein n=1 Tax=Sorangium cellulosum (strain So ce56) TaxID=448385 RepID=A9F0B7_SORC5|nr:hypothetical protein sce1099 [Sorangium cellulosum So ce56]